MRLKFTFEQNETLEMKKMDEARIVWFLISFQVSDVVFGFDDNIITIHGFSLVTGNKPYILIQMTTTMPVKNTRIGLICGVVAFFALVSIFSRPPSEPTNEHVTATTDEDSSFTTFVFLTLSVAILWMVVMKMCFNQLNNHYTTSSKSYVLPAGTRASKLPHEDRMALAIQGPTLVFDGVCHLCNGSMKWFSERCQPEKEVWYMWCQHVDAQSLLGEYGITRDDLLRSWAYIEDGVVYRGSTAWLRAVRSLKRPYCYMHYFILIPLWIRETVYGYIAKNRYKFLGKSDACERPNKFMMARMLHSLQVQEEEGEQDKQKSLVIPKEARKRLLVVGCGPAGMSIAKKTCHAYDVLVVEPKDYFEFTPGILRGMCDPHELKKLHCPLQSVFAEKMGISWIQGVVTKLDSRLATIQWQAPPEQQEEMDKLNRFLVSNSEATGLNDPSIQLIEFDYCVVASGSAYQTSPLWKVFPSPSPTEGAAHFSMSSRVAQMTTEHERLLKLNANMSATAASQNQQLHPIAIVGAGLVGVELAAELCNYYPNLCPSITLYDLAPSILPSFPQRARDYAVNWLSQKGVTIRTNVSSDDIEKAKEGASVVYSCVGVMSTASSFMPPSTIGERKEIVVNEALQVVMISDEGDTLLREQGNAMNSTGIIARPSTLFGSGRIFAIGDCVRVQGLPPFTKDTYPAEAMAGVVVKNLIRSLNAHCTLDHHSKIHMYRIHPLQQITLCSLGPHDCIMILNGFYIPSGWLATFVKHTIQYTKMSEARNEFLGTALWSVIPHL
jgi:NADH dehydrogenase FAD-containing subunit/predicted DCC family thiol-disulfide oxidoreductase YuxK